MFMTDQEVKSVMAGKKIVLFATSGGSTSLGKSAEELAPSAPGAEVINGDIL